MSATEERSNAKKQLCLRKTPKNNQPNPHTLPYPDLLPFCILSPMWPQRNKNISYAESQQEGRVACRACYASATALLLLHQLHPWETTSCLLPLTAPNQSASLKLPVPPNSKTQPFCTHSSCKSVRVHHQPPGWCAKTHQPWNHPETLASLSLRHGKMASLGEG